MGGASALLPRRVRMRPPLVVFWVDALVLLLDVFLLFRFLYRLHYRAKRLRITHKVLNLLCYSFIIGYTLCDLGHSFGCLYSHGGWLETTGYTTWFHFIADMCYFLASLLIYLILLHRLFGTFEQSSYSLAKSRTFWWFSAVLASQTLAFLCYLSLFVICETSLIDAHMDDDEFRRCLRTMGLISILDTLCDYLLNGILLSVMIVKLRRIIIDTATLDLSQLKSHRSRNLLYLTTKLTVVGLWLMGLGQLFFTLRFIFNMISVKPTQTRRFMAAVYICRALEGAYTMFLCDLTFNYSDPLYRTLCRRSHRCVFGCHFSYLQTTLLEIYEEKRRLRMAEENGDEKNDDSREEERNHGCLLKLTHPQSSCVLNGGSNDDGYYHLRKNHEHRDSKASDNSSSMLARMINSLSHKNKTKERKPSDSLQSQIFEDFKQMTEEDMMRSMDAW